MKNFLIVLFLAAILLNILLFFEVRKKGNNEAASTSDTIRVSDTLRFSDTVRIVQTIVKEVPVPIFVDVLDRDTVPADTVLLRTRKTYQTTEYTAIVEGVDPKLAYIETYNLHTSIRDTVLISNSEIITNTIYKPPRWVLSAGVGSGFTPRGVQPFVGISVGYVLWSR